MKKILQLQNVVGPYASVLVTPNSLEPMRLCLVLGKYEKKKKC